METQSFSDDLRRYLFLLWHWAWLLALATLLAAASAYIYSRGVTPVYQASTTMLINEAPATKAADYTSVLTSERLTRTYAQLLTKQPVLVGVIEMLSLEGYTANSLKEAIIVQPVRDTQLIEVRVEDTDPAQAAAIANALVAEFAEQNQALQTSRYDASKQSLQQQLDQLDAQIQANTSALAALGNQTSDQAERDRLEANQAQYRQTYAYLLQSFEQVRLAEAQSTSNVVQAEPASAPLNPIRPRVLTNTLLAAVVGLMASTGLVFLIEALDDTLRDPEDLPRQLGVPVLGLVVRFDTENGGPVTAETPRAPVSEAFRAIRTNIQFASVDRPLRTLLVTSPSPTDGKTTVATNLGVVLAQSELKVILAEGDLRRPQLHRIFRLSNRRGLSDMFVQPQLVLNGLLQRSEMPNLWVLTSGSLPPNPSELLGSGKMVEILGQVSKQADMVVIDSPPLLAVTDAAVMASRVDGVLLVVRPGVTKMAACRQAVEQLRRVGANILGVVLNGVELKRTNSYYHYYKGYYYSYYSHYGESASGKNHKTWPRSKKT